MIVYDRPPVEADPLLSEKAACRAEGISQSTWRRRQKSGDGIPRVRLSQRRYGYRLSAIEARRNKNTESVSA